MRRTFALLATLIVVLAGMSFMSGSSAAIAQQQASGDGAGIVGTWRCEVTRADGAVFQSLLTYGADGTVIAVGSVAQPAPPNAPPGLVFVSPGLGSWQATGSDTVALIFVHLQTNGEGQLTGTITARALVTLGADGQSYTGQAETTIASLDGTVLATVGGTSACTRIVAELPDAATPEA